MPMLAWIVGLWLAASSGAALADPWKDESGKGKWRGGYARSEGGYPGRGDGSGQELRFDPREPRGRSYGSERHGGYGYGGGWDDESKVKMRTADGCEVERKWKKGEYEEKMKCKPGRYGYRYWREGST